MHMKLALLPLALFASTPLMAQQSPALDRLNVSAGVFYGHTKTDLGGRIQGLPQDQRGQVNLENGLGFDDRQNIFRFRADGVIGDHNGWALDYYQFSRSHSRDYAPSIEVNDTPITGTAHLQGHMNLTLASASYRYWFGQSKDVFGVGLGAAYYHVNVDGQGTAIATDGVDVVNESESASYRDGAWAPELSLGYRHAFNDQWRLYADVAGIKKNGGYLSGHIYNGTVGVEYYPWKHVGFGAEYSIARVVLHRRSDNYAANLDLRTDGPGLYVHWRF